jgi:pilus assembly protein FimV
MMVAMLRANPESFINENINGLKRGYILRVPDYNQITSVSQQEALALVREQAALWRQYQQSNAGGQPVSAMEADDMSGDTGSDSAMGVTSGQDDAYLEIVSAGSGSSTMNGKDPTQMSAQELRAE